MGLLNINHIFYCTHTCDFSNLWLENVFLLRTTLYSMFCCEYNCENTDAWILLMCSRVFMFLCTYCIEQTQQTADSPEASNLLLNLQILDSLVHCNDTAYCRPFLWLCWLPILYISLTKPINLIVFIKEMPFMIYQLFSVASKCIWTRYQHGPVWDFGGVITKLPGFHDVEITALKYVMSW